MSSTAFSTFPRKSAGSYPPVHHQHGWFIPSQVLEQGLLKLLLILRHHKAGVRLFLVEPLTHIALSGNWDD